MADPVFIQDGGLGVKLTTLRDNLLSNLQLRLYRVDRVPAAGDVVTDYVECTFSGYSSQTFSDLGAVSVSGGAAQVSTGVHTFSHSGGPTANSVYGWFAVDSQNRLICASRNGAGPVTLAAAGQSYSVQVTFTDQRAP